MAENGGNIPLNVLGLMKYYQNRLLENIPKNNWCFLWIYT